MPNVGPFELAIVLIIALVVFGPKRLPELGRSLGKGIREFKGSISGDHDDPKPPATAAPHIEASKEAPVAQAPEAAEAPEDEPVAHDRG
jgi:sec-independent protein translocase protein TatA